MTGERFEVTIGAQRVVGVLHLPAGLPAPCVVACHGMGASKDGDKYLLLGRELPAAGLGLCRFDFRGSGDSGGEPALATVGSRIADCIAVLDHLGRRDDIDGRFGLLGSSLGGFVALWVAALRGAGLPVVTWNAPAALQDLGDVNPEAPDGPGPALVAEVRAGCHAEAPAGVSHVLVIQGDRDTVVPPRHGEALMARAGEPRALVIVAGGDHRLSETRHRQHALDASRRWLCHHLLTGRAAPRSDP